jgi:hypothetical protein
LRQLFNVYCDALSNNDYLRLNQYFTDDAKISMNGNIVASSAVDFIKLLSEYRDAECRTIEIPLIMAFFADEGNGTAHGNFTIESRSIAATGKSSVEIFKSTDTYKRTSSGWRCSDRQRKNF